MKRSHRLSALMVACLACGFNNANAFSLIESEQTTLNADIEIALGAFNIDKNFNGKEGGSSWQEGYAKYGFSGQWDTFGTLYGAVNAVSSGTWGDGDPAGLTVGNERRTAFEEVYLGWRFSKGFEGASTDFLDISAGRQVITIGNGFIINDDGLNMGNGISPSLNRGGAYYLAARHAFDKTATINLSITENIHGRFIYIKSDNRAQAKTGMYIADINYTSNNSALGFSWIHGKDVDLQFADDFQMQRKGMNVYSLRGKTDTGLDNLFLSFEFARQYRNEVASGLHTGNNDNSTAWHTQADWELNNVVDGSLAITYRYSRYSKTWDSLFSGFNQGFGTWFQGEVAANYAGPFNTNTGIHHVGFKLNSSDKLSIGLLYFDFKPVKRNGTDLGGGELDIYGEWAASQNLMLIPLIGLYRPDKDQSNGGVQQTKGYNMFSQIMLAFNF